MCSVFMDIYPLDFFAIEIASEVLPFVDDQTYLPVLFCELCETGAIKSRADNQIVIFFA